MVSIINKNGTSKSTRMNECFSLRFSLLAIFILVCCCCSTGVESLNNIGCRIEPKVCESYEYCVDDNVLGFCVSENDRNEFTREAIRSETPIETYIDAPIRIHKYNVDEDDVDSSEPSSSSSSQEPSKIEKVITNMFQASAEQEEQDQPSPRQLDEEVDYDNAQQTIPGRLLLDRDDLDNNNNNNIDINGNQLNQEEEDDEEEKEMEENNSSVVDDSDDDSLLTSELARYMTKRALQNDDYDLSDDEIESASAGEPNYVSSYEPDVLDYQDKMNGILDKLDNEDDYLLNNENDYDGDEENEEDDESANTIESSSPSLAKRDLNGLRDDDDYFFDLNNNNNNNINEEDAYLYNNVNTDDDELSDEAQPLIVEKEGIDRNGNRFYEKDVILDTDIKTFPKVTPTQIAELVRKENQLYLERLNKMREQALKRRMAAIAHAQLSGYMGNAAPLVVASLLPTDKEIAEAKLNGRATSNEELFGWIKPVSESRSTFEIEMPSSSPDAENDKPKRDRFEIDSYDEEPLTSSSDEDVSKFQRQNQEVRKQEKEYLDKLSSEKSEENDLSNKIEAAFSQEMESKKSETQYKKKPAPSESSSESIEIVDRSYIAVELNKHVESQDVEKLTKSITDVISFLPRDWLKYVELKDNLVFIKLDKDINSDDLIQQINNKKDEIYKLTGLKIVSCGLGHDDHYVLNSKLIDTNSENFLLVTIIICATVAAVLLTLIIVFLIRRRSLLRERLSNDVLSGLNKKPLNDEERLINDSFQTAPKSWKSFWPFRSSVADQNEMSTSSNNYQELCRQRMQGKGSPTAVSNESASIVPSSSNNNTSNNSNAQPSRVTSSSDNKTESTRSSTSSWSEEPIQTVNMDITTGHVILAYIEEYLNDKNRLTKEWNDLCEYEADINKTESAQLPQNMTKNRYSNILAYDHSRVKLDDNKNSDYINANFITDDDPKNPAYIATQGPLIHTTCDFWKMIWEQGSVVIVSLCRTVEYGSLKCNQYWPANGCEVYDKFEVHLVSEHVWCDDYLVRSFYLKNLETNQSRTVTQFHFLTWPETGLPPNIKSLLDFRRKVNKSYKSKASPIIVHCNDGVGRTGTYIMIDMVLNKIIKGAKEIDLAAIVEFLRDQRPSMIKSKAQFEFSFAVITEEVQNMLKAIAQN